ncbi:Short-chain dehydrogenase/reductase [Trema orientale]|uniref:Short-chain dehydrogenase/reductase n=1 Tax=Trema orientale TaxID=63057 RepID=A0A2P5EKG2_TREOI|nr:Short-chain dehydrogenase/reductase [Trema orientale]
MSSTTTESSSKNKLEGKVAIITGGASGIGEATARLFADHGAAMVVIADIQDELGYQVAESIGACRCTYARCDVTDEEQVKSLVESTVRKYGRLDIMFCNAGIGSRSEQTVLELDLSAFDRLLAVNARGTAVCVKHAARAMVERRVRGSIVCTASVVATRGARKWTDYCVSKHALLGLVRSASLQLGEHGIRVNCVSPSGVATPLSCSANGMEPAELEKRYESFSSLKGVVLKTRHVADAVLFLASDESEFVTGHNLEIHGGFTRT